jgi:hypothetical protein
MNQWETDAFTRLLGSVLTEKTDIPVNVFIGAETNVEHELLDKTIVRVILTRKLLAAYEEDPSKLVEWLEERIWELYEGTDGLNSIQDWSYADNQFDEMMRSADEGELVELSLDYD